MFCTKCGSRIEDGMRFCTSCGAKKKDAVPAAEQNLSHPNDAELVNVGEHDNVACVAEACEQVAPANSVGGYVPAALKSDSANNGAVAATNTIAVPKTAIVAVGVVIAIVAAVATGVFVLPAVFGDKADTSVSAEVSSESSILTEELPNEESDANKKSTESESDALSDESETEASDKTNANDKTNEADKDNSVSIGSNGNAGTSNNSDTHSQNEEYVLADSDSRYYTESELNAMSLKDLYYARNEIYARHGRGFKNADLTSYFQDKSWYEERYSPDEFDAMSSPLNEYEKKNADLMLEVEKRRNSSYLD